MDYYTIRNTVIIALLQVGVIVGGVLAAADCLKWQGMMGFSPPSLTALLAQYGFLALGLPVVWTVAALQAQRGGSESEVSRMGAFYSGIALLLLLLLGVGYAAVLPLFRIMQAAG